MKKQGYFSKLDIMKDEMWLEIVSEEMKEFCRCTMILFWRKVRTHIELNQIEKEVHTAFTQTVIVQDVQICCDALDLVKVYQGLDFGK